MAYFVDVLTNVDVTRDEKLFDNCDFVRHEVTDASRTLVKYLLTVYFFLLLIAFTNIIVYRDKYVKKVNRCIKHAMQALLYVLSTLVILFDRHK